ncbi:N-(5'phosphoribosyl)anthranilate isomerase [Hyphomonas neptunium ATCC 15444]|uniref:N-(5'-phosphoribosyl)anthranilate isomerase n=2 Tax=Hyphomonas TaxID=85 RepID=TRPF_HYPNA|nr:MULTISPECIES: phosphoribosylanthranilate isomerase [Hyphomonas]Q0BWJ4.1 RecName: Full=N-(5'-phosphoribosyl)anthranilate isomerase; Short=PRAI [Hyphomonas neptunium ATCC 15444]ABI75671.1 N-(5'phosphoribosyl)anthranilate isomerase [Hyphomonas neptunium ATCC 15444]KCZ94725.1 N-(5'phosphoribosyl)anthranilate isomerase [Hyphomonas hirschiana VP5]
MAKVKICGLKDPDMVAFAAREGADWVGFVFAPSVRQVTLAAAETLLLSVGKATPVALMVDPSDAEAQAVAALGFPILQLHGQETPARAAELKSLTGCAIWKAIGVQTRDNLGQIGTFPDIDGLLLDAKPPEGATIAGGHGAAFDWSILKGWTAPKPWLLAGGLTPENVAEAIAATGAPGVDVSSGVERIRGLKDRELVRAFIRAAKASEQP